MKKKSEIGRLGEKIAGDRLENNGYKIVERNFWRPWGEIDIIAKAKDGTLVFVEVKTMQVGGDENFSLKPEDNLTKAKLEKLKRTASLYAGSHQKLVSDKKGWRIDLVAIGISGELTNSQENCDIQHWENVG